VKLLKLILNNNILYTVLSICIRFIDFLLPIKRNFILFHGYGGRYVGNVKALYLYYKKQIDSDLNPIWLLDEKDMNIFNDSYEFTYSLPSNNSNLFSKIKFLCVLIKSRVIIVTSIGDIYKYRNMLCKIKHIEVVLFNGSSLKSTGIMAKHLNKDQKKLWKTKTSRFDLISACSRFDKYVISSGFNVNPEQIEIMGPQRSDLVDINSTSKKINKIAKIGSLCKIDNTSSQTFVLYAPTHRDHKAQNSFDFGMLSNLANFNAKTLNNKLMKLNTHILLRDHLNTNNINSVKRIRETSNIHNFSNKIISDIDDVIDGFDIVITDYSGIYLELLDKHQSLAFIPYDLEEYEFLRGLCLPYDLLAVGPQLNNQDDLINYLRNRKKADKEYAGKKEYLSNLFFEVQKSTSCQKTFQAIDKMI
jgi:CDP-glycerol glycerophosphotransferase (TagB/SpsB family)